VTSSAARLAGAFRAMGTDVQLWLGGAGDAAGAEAEARVRTVFAVFEATLSRFRADSDLARANAEADGAWHARDPVLVRALALALGWARRLHGLFDPTVLPALLAAGYDQSFDRLPSDRPTGERSGSPPTAGRWREVGVDVRRGRVRLPPGVAVDLGGIGKGLAVDTAVAVARGCAPTGLVNAGGDLAAWGRPGVRGWTVRVADPWDPEGWLAEVELRGRRRAVATSSTLRRRWRVGGEVRHHLIDPRTGRPAEGPVVQATVWAESATAADVLAKALLLAGPEGADRLLVFGGLGAGALLALAGGSVVALGACQGVRPRAG
jgi:thiamine biosynthesis lipoprotein